VAVFGEVHLKAETQRNITEVFEPMHIYKVFHFKNNTRCIWSHVLFFKVNISGIYLYVCSEPTEKFRCKMYNVLSYTWLVCISYPIAPCGATDHLTLLNRVFIRIAKKSYFYDLQRKPRIFGVPNRILRYTGTEPPNTYKSVTVPRRMRFLVIYICFLGY
jgi:hypothetical protein